MTEFPLSEPSTLSLHQLFGGSIVVSRFRTRFGDVVWMIDEVNDDGLLGEELYQGDRAGAVQKIRDLAKVWNDTEKRATGFAY